MKIKVNKEACCGCLLCEVTCSLVNTGMVQREASAIQVTLGDLTDSIHEPILCRQCRKMLCLRSEGKEFDGEESRKFWWDNESRAEDCPFRALFHWEGKIVHCNLCAHDPQCVKSCPTSAISMEK
jgi:anaerobic carbon-monoxide dehydrogenase iron sulfur subunit